jgi:hypothetical protein
MLFGEHACSDELWRDFSNASPLEELRSELELAIDRLSRSSSAAEFTVGGAHYSLRYASGPPAGLPCPMQLFGLAAPYLRLSSDAPLDPAGVCCCSAAPLLFAAGGAIRGSALSAAGHSVFTSSSAAAGALSVGALAAAVRARCGPACTPLFSRAVTYEAGMGQRVVYSWPPEPWPSPGGDSLEDARAAPACAVHYAAPEFGEARALRALRDGLPREFARRAWAGDAQEPPAALPAGPNPYIGLLASRLGAGDFDAAWLGVRRFFERCVEQRAPIGAISADAVPRGACLLDQKMVMVAIQIARMRGARQLSAQYTSDQFEPLARAAGDAGREVLEAMIEAKAAGARACPTEQFAAAALTAARLEELWGYIREELFDPELQAWEALEFLMTRYPCDVARDLAPVRCRMEIERLGVPGAEEEIATARDALLAKLGSFEQADDVVALVEETVQFQARVLEMRLLLSDYGRCPEFAKGLYRDKQREATSQAERDAVFTRTFLVEEEPFVVKEAVCIGVATENDCEVTHRLCALWMPDETAHLGIAVTTKMVGVPQAECREAPENESRHNRLAD